MEIVSGNNVIKGLVINGFSNFGIDINGEAAKMNVIEATYIGTNAAGTDTVSNALGIYISEASENIIGGSAPDS